MPAKPGSQQLHIQEAVSGTRMPLTAAINMELFLLPQASATSVTRFFGLTCPAELTAS